MYIFDLSGSSQKLLIALQPIAPSPHHTVPGGVFDREISGNCNGVCPWRWHVPAREEKGRFGRSRGSIPKHGQSMTSICFRCRCFRLARWKFLLASLASTRQQQLKQKRAVCFKTYVKQQLILMKDVVLMTWSGMQARWFFQQLIIGLDYCHKVEFFTVLDLAFGSRPDIRLYSFKSRHTIPGCRESS